MVERQTYWHWYVFFVLLLFAVPAIWASDTASQPVQQGTRAVAPGSPAYTMQAASRMEKPPAPSFWSLIWSAIKAVCRRLTWLHLLGLALLPLAWYVFQEVRRDVLIFDPFSVPKRFEDAGITSRVLTSRIGNALDKLETETRTSLKKDVLGYAHVEGSTPEIEIPGTKIGLKSLVEIARTLFRRYPRHVGGAICLEGLAKSDGGGAVALDEMATVYVYVTHGRNHREINRFKAKSSDLDGIVHTVAENALEHLNPLVFAVCLLERKEMDRSLDIARRIADDTTEKPFSRAGAFNLCGRHLHEQKQYEKATEQYKLALNHQPQYAPSLNNWGLSLQEQKNYPEAIEKYKKTIDINPRYAPGYNNWGNALQVQKNYPMAIEKYKKAINIDPKNAPVYNNWGNALLAQKNYPEAIEKYKKAIDIDPKHADAYYNWGIALTEQKNYSEAIEKYKKTTEIDPKHARAYTIWGNALIEQENYSEAIEKYKKAIDIDPKYADAYHNWGVALEAMGLETEAREKFAKVDELDNMAADQAS